MMQKPKIFITGVTGYIGGDALYALHQKYPDWEYSVLVRSQEKADKTKATYPDVRIVLGDLDDSDLLREEAAKADVVIHAADASDHEGAACAIAAGMVSGHSASRPGFWLHTSGTGILTYLDSFAHKLGEWSNKQFSDVSGVAEMTSLPDEAFHRNVDKVVLECGTQHADKVKTAVMCPPTIYGTGRGPVSGRSKQAYELGKLILEKGYAPIVGDGQARWNNVHVYDLSDAFVLLVEAAVAGNRSDELWGAKGYYFAENGEHSWSDFSRAMAKKAFEMGYLKEEPKEQKLNHEEALAVAGFQAESWGLNSRGKAERLSKFLGWKPKGPSIEDEIPEILKNEKARLEGKT